DGGAGDLGDHGSLRQWMLLIAALAESWRTFITLVSVWYSRDSRWMLSCSCRYCMLNERDSSFIARWASIIGSAPPAAAAGTSPLPPGTFDPPMAKLTTALAPLESAALSAGL